MSKKIYKWTKEMVLEEASKGITVMHVKEKDYIDNIDKVREDVLRFLYE